MNKKVDTYKFLNGATINVGDEFWFGDWYTNRKECISIDVNGDIIFLNSCSVYEFTVNKNGLWIGIGDSIQIKPKTTPINIEIDKTYVDKQDDIVKAIGYEDGYYIFWFSEGKVAYDVKENQIDEWIIKEYDQYEHLYNLKKDDVVKITIIGQGEVLYRHVKEVVEDGVIVYMHGCSSATTKKNLDETVRYSFDKVSLVDKDE